MNIVQHTYFIDFVVFYLLKWSVEQASEKLKVRLVASRPLVVINDNGQ